MLLELAPLPVKIEAIVDDPTAGALPRENINVGYDARDSRAPNTWKATATLPDDGSDALTTLNIVKDVTGAGTTITTVGGLFDGDSLARKDPMGGAITYTPVPDAGDARPHARLVHGGPRRRQPARRRQGPRRDRRRAARAARELQPRRAAAEPARAPRGAGHEPAHRDLRRLGERAVARRDVQRRHGGVLATKVVAKASGLPTGMVLHQTGARAATFDATGGTLGSVEVGYANGEPRLLDERDPSVRAHLRRRHAEVLRGPDRRAAVGLGRRDDEDHRRAAARARSAQAVSRARRHAGRPAHRRPRREPAAPPEGALRRRRRGHRLQRVRRDDRRHHARRRADGAVLRPRQAHPRPHQRAAVAGDGEHQAQRAAASSSTRTTRSARSRRC